jgi:hypothetical protein
MFREDVIFIPGLARAFPSPSLSHLWPLAKMRFALLYRQAVKRARRGEAVQSAVYLGRAMHVLIDMACPVHAQAVAHYLRDPYERYVDTHAQELATMPLPTLPATLEKASVTEIIALIAHASRSETADLTQSPWGRLLKSIGRRRSLSYQQIAPQAQRLIPLTAACLRVLLQKFAMETDGFSLNRAALR